MNFKRILLAFICLSILLFTGCDEKTLDPFKAINLESVDYIRISIGEEFKDITEDNDVKTLLDNLTSFQLEDNNTERRGYSISIQLFNQLGDLIENIILIGDNVAINNEWYKTDIMKIKSFEEEYLSMSYDLKINLEKQKELNKKVEKRKAIDLIDALKGTWVLENNTSIYFDETYLYQEGYKFEYIMDSAYGDVIILSVFGESNIFNEDGKLFNMIISLDETKTKAKLEKIMTPVLRYKYNMVYVDLKHNKLGTFQSDFFEVTEP